MDGSSLLREGRLTPWIETCPRSCDVLEPANKEGIFLELKEEFEDHEDHVLITFELVS